MKIENTDIEKKEKTLEIKSWLPIFPGFYNTIFEYCDEDSDVEYLNELREEKKLTGKIEFDHIDFDYKSYENDVAISCCNILEHELNEFISKIEFENILSPSEYNYRNNSINCTYTLTNENINSIKTFIKNHLKEFSQYLKNRYTSYDGFISYYSSEVKDWKITKKFLMENGHNLGSILNFICQLKGINEEILYDGYEAYMSFLNEKSLTTKHVCSYCNEFINNSEDIKIINNYIKTTGKVPNKAKCYNCQHHIK